jgi:acylphosphatase
MPRRYSRKAEAGRLLDEGMRLHDTGEDERALAAYAQAARMRRDWAVPWYNAGLIHKYRGAWQASLDANLRAHRLDPREPAALWNLGIAATAVGQWEQARQAWRAYGIPVGDGSGPIDYFIGLTPIRVSVDDAPEVVWADRIDPARAVIRSVPLPATGRRWGDLVLHDGAPVGYRMLGGNERAVFNELALLQASSHSTFEVFVSGVSEQEIERFIQSCEAQGVAVENWSTSLRTLCKACSEGRPHEQHDHDHGPAANEHDGRVRLGVAAPSQARAESVFEDWLSSHPALRVDELRCVLRAGHLQEVGRA